MDPVLFATICIMILIVAVSVGFWARSHSVRPVVGGLGASLLPLGLFLAGVMHLIYNGVWSIISWAQRTAWSTQMSWGAGLFGAGLVLLVITGAMKPHSRRRDDKASERDQQQPDSVSPSPAGKGLPAKPGGSPAKKQVDPEDAEVEAILRKRGIM